MSLKIKTLKLKGIRQFQDVTFDFTDPKTGKPLDKICLIGGNGTGKSTILKFLASNHGLGIPFSLPPWIVLNAPYANCAIQFDDGVKSATKTNAGNWLTKVECAFDSDSLTNPRINSEEAKHWQNQLLNSVSVFCPPDAELEPNSRKVSSVPNSNLDMALRLLKEHQSKFKVGQDSVIEFWQLLIALVKDRESRLLEYQRFPENKDRTIRQVEAEFLSKNPEIFKELADFWEPILAKAGLKFDYAEASIPVQLTDNVKAYIKLAADNAVIPYADLRTGIRSFLFRLGHLFTIFRFHPNKGGIVLIDEPENSLHPDFLFDLVGYYEQSAPGAQMFFATHSPIVAAQFKPEERFILEFDSELGVVVRRGVSPEGDDPNDILTKDFAVRTLYGKRGLEKWKRFRALDRLIQEETDTETRKKMMREYLELGRIYNFSPHDEISA